MSKAEIVDGCAEAVGEILNESEMESVSFSYDDTLDCVTVNGPDEVLDKIAVM